jgi:hypothetical protein
MWHYQKKPTSLKEKIQKARFLGEHWLYLANLADECGKHELAKRHLARGQKWLDELNVLEGYGNGSEA